MNQTWWTECRRWDGADLDLALRLGLIASTETKQWFEYGGSTEYLRALHRSWVRDPGPHTFMQRLQILFVSGVSQRSRRPRELVKSLAGRVPYLGSGLFESTSADCDGSAVLAWFFDSGAYGLAQVSARTAYDGDLLERARQTLARGLTGDFSDHHCGDGSFLAALLGALGDASAISRLFGSCETETDVTIARFRLATVALNLMDGDEPTPLPDLRLTIRCAGGMPSKGVEGSRLEFKSSYEWNTRTGAKSEDLRFGCLRTIAAFLNSQGGELRIGVDDQGTVVGLEHELELLKSPKPQDVFEGKLREYCKNVFDPPPTGLIEVKFAQHAGLTMCSVLVQPSANVTYLVRRDEAGRRLEEVFVRDGNRTVALQGKARDLFVIEKLASGK